MTNKNRMSEKGLFLFFTRSLIPRDSLAEGMKKDVGVTKKNEKKYIKTHVGSCLSTERNCFILIKNLAHVRIRIFLSIFSSLLVPPACSFFFS